MALSDHIGRLPQWLARDAALRKRKLSGQRGVLSGADFVPVELNTAVDSYQQTLT
jgi:hypothetical protein